RLALERRSLLAIGRVLAALEQEVNEIVPAERRRVPIGELLRVLFVRGVEVGRLHQVHERTGFVSSAAEVVRAARVVTRSGLRVRLSLRALHRRLTCALPALRGHEASLRRLPQLRAGGPVERAIGVRFTGARRVVELFVELAQALEQPAPRLVIGDARSVRRDDLRGSIERARLDEHLRRRGDRLIVFGRLVGDALPRLGGRRRVLALHFVERRQLLQQEELFLEVDFAVLFLLVEVREIVPALRSFEQPRQRLARRLVAVIDGEELLPRREGAVGVAQVALAEPRHFAQPVSPRLDRLARRPHRRQEHVAKGSVVALRSQVVLHPRQRLGVHRILLEDFAVLLVSVRALARLCQRLRLVERTVDPPRQGGGAPAHGIAGGALGRRRERRVGRHRPAHLGVEIAQLGGGLGIAERAQGLEDLDRVLLLVRAFVARREQPSGLARHGAPGVGLDVREVADADVVFAGEGLRVEGVELNGSVVAGIDVESARRIREAVLAVVRLGETDEERHREGALVGGDRLTIRYTLDDDRAVLLLEGDVLGVELTRAGKHLRGPGEIARRALACDVVAQEGDLSRRVPELDGAAQVLLRLLRLLEVVVPQTTELFVHLCELGPDLRVLRRDARERLRSPLEQRDQGLVVGLLAIELRQPVRRHSLRGVAIDRL